MIYKDNRKVVYIYKGDKLITKAYKGTALVYKHEGQQEESGTFVRAEGNWTQELNVFTSNPINHNEVTGEKVWLKGLGGQTITLEWDVDSEKNYDLLNFYELDSETTKIFESKNMGDTQGSYGRYGAFEYTFPDDEEHFIYMTFSKDGSGTYGRDNAIVTFPMNLFGTLTWRVVEGEYIIEDVVEGEKLYEVTYQKMQAYFGDVPLDQFEKGKIISKVEKELENYIRITTTPDASGNVIVNYNDVSTFGSGGTMVTEAAPLDDKLIIINGDLISLQYFLRLSSPSNVNNKITNLELNLDTSQVGSFFNMFAFCSSLTDINFVKPFDTGNVANMSNAFYYTKLSDFSFLNDWDFSNVTNIYAMFSNTSSLTDIDLSEISMPKLINIGELFKLSTVVNVKLPHLQYSNITQITDMFSGCTMLETVDATDFVPSTLTNISEMFKNCSKLTTIIGYDNWNTSSLTNISGLFRGCSKLTSLDLSNWDTSNVTNFSYLFYNCSQLSEITGIENINTSSATNMSGIFGFSKLTNIDVSNWDTSKVTNMNSMFAYSSISSLDLTNLNLSQVSYMSSTFNDCSNLTSITFNPTIYMASLINTSFMFSNCSKLTTLNLKQFNMRQVTDASYMFSGCTNLESIEGTYDWDFNSIENVSNMFSNCSKLKSVDFSDVIGWKNITSSSKYTNMFSGCSSLETITARGDLYNFLVLRRSNLGIPSSTDIIQAED